MITRNYLYYKALVFASDGVRVRVVNRVIRGLMKIKNPSRKQSHKHDGIGVGRTRMFPFSSDSAYNSVAYDLVKTGLLELEAEAEG